MALRRHYGFIFYQLLSGMSIHPAHFCELFSVDNRRIQADAPVFCGSYKYKNAADALRSCLKQVTQPEQYVQRAEAVGHEQLLPRNLPPEAIRQDENFGKIRARAEKIRRCAQQFVDIRQRKRGQKQNSRRACREVARDEQDMLPPCLLRLLLLHDGVNRVLFLHAASPML